MSAGPQTGRSRVQVRIRGAVQGVGFRPFVYRLAMRHDISGFVLNDGEGVLLEAEGVGLDAFVAAVAEQPPPLARIDRFEVTALASDGGRGFEIKASRGGAAQTRIVPDAATCEDCLEELFDPASRFYLYPFITCTQCGPRFTIAHGLPYDRARTSMSAFPMCPACARDYRDVAGRRFHAETIACPACGPRLSHPVQAVAASLGDGQIVALKGIGGFHLLCDARSEAAVAKLRARKRRDGKPFAVMVANQASVALVAAPGDTERALLAASARPIVLLSHPQRVAPGVAPGLDRIGVMLPYAPVHHLLFHALSACAGDKLRAAPVATALVVTSANPAGEPLIVDDEEARARLAGIADLVVTHDRAIVRRADDSVMAVIDGAPAYLRRSRGPVPEPIDLGEAGPVVVGVGGFLKTTVTVTRGREAFLSQHLGDLDRAATIRFYEAAAHHLLELLGAAPEAVACDLHPDFPSTRFAETLGVPIRPVQHHAAHLAAVAAEHRRRGPILGVALDGNGTGDDGGAWGGELMRLEAAHWRRLGHLTPLPLPGGDRAAREPWRMGVAALAALGRGDAAAAYFPDQRLAGPLLHTLAGPGIGTTTSMGRLFDAAAALLGLRTHQDYEAQAAMELEALVRAPHSLPGGYRLAESRLDFRPLLAALIELRGDPCTGADIFHGTLIEGLTAWIAAAAAATGLRTVVLGGGCFANRSLAGGLASALRARGLEPLLPRLVPANDGGLSLGQACLARAALMDAGEPPRNSGERPPIGKDAPCASPFPSA